MSVPLVALYVTAPTKLVAETIAESLVSKQLAACVNICQGVTSVYRWEGKVEKSEEVLLMIKSRSALIDDIVKDVKSNHPYQVPEVISVPLGPGNADYLEWVAHNTVVDPPKSDV